ncbi:hypothetical protein A0U93_02265 [Neoasaia chiangmaiensis]|uniref:DUF2497 domain-containing protein n=2 Tax=Neoasaia chiangmaiensis TaxID=320497 RepID=A0A1U9KMF0_9PROT|nr:hypothetical protein A0U93_02265 [Neoasaia chiangmaiensis]
MSDVLHSIRQILQDDEMETDVTRQRAQSAPETLVLDSSMRVVPARSINTKNSDHELLSDDIQAATNRSFETLQSALDAQPASGHIIARTTAVTNGASLTIEDLVRQEVRQMVGGWLEANLPSMVETLVRAEISRMTSRR